MQRIKANPILAAAHKLHHNNLLSKRAQMTDEEKLLLAAKKRWHHMITTPFVQTRALTSYYDIWKFMYNLQRQHVYLYLYILLEHQALSNTPQTNRIVM